MARSSITSTTNEANTDAGSILFSMVMGEQLEFPIDINFYPDASQLLYEAVVMEAAPGDNPPTAVKVGGVNTVLATRFPTYMGVFNPAAFYNRGEMVLYNNVYWELTAGTNYKNTLLTPATDPMWRTSGLNRVYIRVPSTLGTTWSTQPSVTTRAYGFLEVACSELPMVTFPFTWKPIRGIIELQFSPTQLVP